MKKIYNKLLLFILFFMSIPLMLYAQDKTFLAEARRHVLSLITSGEILSKNTDLTFTQKNNQQAYITSVITENETVITIVPKINGIFVPSSSRGSWEIVFDAYKDIKKARLYLQSMSGFYIDFVPNFNSTIISVVIGDVVMFNAVSVSIAFNTLITMPFEKILRQTRGFIQWNLVFPKNMDYTPHENNRNLAAYLTQHFDTKRLPESRGTNDTDRVTWYQSMLTQYINLFLQFVGKSAVPSIQFSPVNENRTLQSIKEPNFLNEYTKNIVDFMYQFPEFYTANSHIRESLLPPNSLAFLTVYLYMWCVQYAQHAFIVVIDEVQSTTSGELLNKNIGVRLYIPYFTPSGRFTWYTSDTDAWESKNIDMNKKNIHYTFSLYSLRAPRFHMEYQ